MVLEVLGYENGKSIVRYACLTFAGFLSKCYVTKQTKTYFGSNIENEKNLSKAYKSVVLLLMAGLQ